MKTCRYLRLHTKIISWRFHIMTHFTFWDMCTWYIPFFYQRCFSSTQLQCCITFSWMELQVLLRCCLIHVSMVMIKHFLCLLHLHPCLDLGLFMSYLCDLFFIFIFIFIMINQMILWMQTQLFCCLLFRICPIIFGQQCEWRVLIIFI